MQTNVQPIGWTTTVLLSASVVMLGLGLTGGFISGHVLGKSSNQNATDEAVEAAELAMADLAEEAGRKTKLQSMLDSLKSEIRHKNQSIDSLQRDVAEFKKITSIQTNADDLEIRNLSQGIRREKNFDDEVMRLKKHLIVLLEEEPSRSRELMKKAASSDADELLTLVRKDHDVLDNRSIVDILGKSYLHHVIMTYNLKRGLEDKNVISAFRFLWKEKWTTRDFASYVALFFHSSKGIRSDIIDSIAKNKKPITDEGRIVIELFSGKETLEKLH